MEIQASRSGARVGPSGEPILLLDQNRARWDQLLIHRGFAALERAEQLGGTPGTYTMQAAIAACHARARTAAETDWRRIAALYDALAQLTPSPIVELNRAVAYAMAFGPAAGLEIVDALTSEPALQAYHLLPSVRPHSRATRASARCSSRAPNDPGSSDVPDPNERQDLLRRDSRARHPALGGLLRHGVWLEHPEARRRRHRIRRHHGRGERQLGARPPGGGAAGPAHLHHGGQRGRDPRRRDRPRRRRGATGRRGRARDHGAVPRSRGQRGRSVPGAGAVGTRSVR